MENELIDLNGVNIIFKKSEIVIENKEILDNAIQNVVEKYKDLVVTEETFAAGKKSRAELNRIKKSLDDRRKEIKKEFSEPLKVFETDIKKYLMTIDSTMTQIDSGIKFFEDKQRKQKLDEVNEMIVEMAPNYGVEITDIEIDPTWLNKTTPHVKVVKGIGDAMTYAFNQKKELAQKYEAVAKYCETSGMDQEGFMYMVPTYDLTVILTQIDNAKKAKEERAQAEKDAEVAKLETQKAELTKVDDKLVNAETGEVKHEYQQIQLTIQGSEEQLKNLATYMKFNDIKVIARSGYKTVIE